MTRIKNADLSGANCEPLLPRSGENGEEEDVVREGDESVAAQVVEDGVAAEVLVEVLVDPNEKQGCQKQILNIRVAQFVQCRPYCSITCRRRSS